MGHSDQDEGEECVVHGSLGAKGSDVFVARGKPELVYRHRRRLNEHCLLSRWSYLITVEEIVAVRHEERRIGLGIDWRKIVSTYRLMLLKLLKLMKLVIVRRVFSCVVDEGECAECPAEQRRRLADGNHNRQQGKEGLQQMECRREEKRLAAAEDGELGGVSVLLPFWKRTSFWRRKCGRQVSNERVDFTGGRRVREGEAIVGE